jgi:hypothetical protein
MDTDDILLLAVGAALGGFLVYIFLKRPVAAPASAQLHPIGMNAETIEWIDYKGNKRQINVHREVKG